MSERGCPACGGTGLTSKVQHTVELDETGNQVPRRYMVTTPCGHCGGKGWVS